MYEREGESESFCGPCVLLPVFLLLCILLFFFFFSLFQHWANFELKFISLSLAVRFSSCGQGGLVWFECSNPSDFRIEADGVVYAAKTLQRSALPASPLLIKASDTTTRQEWVTQVRLTTPKQVMIQSNCLFTASLMFFLRNDRMISSALKWNNWHLLGTLHIHRWLFSWTAAGVPLDWMNAS